MNQELTFLPYPRYLNQKIGDYKLNSDKLIQIKTEAPHKDLFIASQIANCLEEHHKISWELTASQSIPSEYIGLRLTVNPELVGHSQGYFMRISEKLIDLIGNDSEGLFYGAQSLKQIISQSQHNILPCMEIEDWPDFPVRGVMLDISRDKVYRLETLYMLIDELASWKVNQLQLYTEHTFAYLGHEVVWQDSSPMTAQDILALDRYCAERFITLIPNQNAFGHMTRWLKHPKYEHLAERTQPASTPWGHMMTEPFSLAPTLSETHAFISGLFDQLLPNFSARMVNVGCDETFDLGLGKSKEICASKGKGQVYLDYLLNLHQDLSRRGYQMQFWADIILQYPDLVSKVPQDVIALDWGYEANHPFEIETRKLKEAGLPYYVCPGTSSWNSIGGRVANMLENCKNAAQSGLNHDAIGYLLTDWGDNGHWQQLPISYPGFVAGAAFSWCLESHQNFDLAKILNNIVFRDHSELLGQMMIAIGNEYQAWGLELPNSSPLFWLLQENTSAVKEFDIKDHAPIQACLIRLQNYQLDLAKVNLDRFDSIALKDELKITLDLLSHACKRALFIYGTEPKITKANLLREIQEIIEHFKVRWLSRNRPGGLSDSLARFNTVLKAYQTEHDESDFTC